MSTSFQSFANIVSAALGNGEVLLSLVTYAAAGELRQAEEGTAAAICERFGLKKASLSVLQKMPKSTWQDGGRQLANPATTIYTYALALRKCGDDVDAMMALTPSGITRASKPDAPKKARGTAAHVAAESTDTGRVANEENKKAGPAVSLTVADAIQCILTAHSVGGLSETQYAQLRSIIEPVTIVPTVQRVDTVMVAH